jgi:hypothetical protein
MRVKPKTYPNPIIAHLAIPLGLRYAALYYRRLRSFNLRISRATSYIDDHNGQSGTDDPACIKVVLQIQFFFVKFCELDVVKPI